MLLYQAYTLTPNIKNKKRRELFEEINELEKDLNITECDNKYFNILNGFIINKHYTIAVIISRILGFSFNQPTLRMIIRKISLILGG